MHVCKHGRYTGQISFNPKTNGIGSQSFSSAFDAL